MTVWSRLRALFSADVIVQGQSRPLAVRYSSPEMAQPIHAKLRMASKVTQKFSGPTAAERARARQVQPEQPSTRGTVTRFPRRGDR